jgi:glutamate/tyrosine decarboxylase-like PLP-dependent enzyme
MHRYNEETDATVREIVDYAVARIKMDPPPLDGPLSDKELESRVGDTITAAGLGPHEALRVFTEELAPAVISVDNPRFLAFVPTAPTKSSILFDLAVSASSIFGGTWLEASGAIFAENQALAWLAGLAGLPAGAGGVFVSGGSAANLSALVAARHTAEASGRERPNRWRVAASTEAHSSVLSALRVMDAAVLTVPADDHGRLTERAVREALDRAPDAEVDGLFAIVATAGTTNPGTVDDLAGVAAVCRERGLWLHVDGAYGGAALAAPSVRDRFAGIEHADSFVIDPHKWLFAPYDCAALLYARPIEAARAHMQEAGYLDHINALTEWSPAHYAFHLSRRARGLPFWFSLASHGTDAYVEAIETTLRLTRETAEEIRRRPQLELIMEPELSVVLFRRTGWSSSDYTEWSDRLLRDQVAFVAPTTWDGERALRLCFVNPLTTIEDVREILDSIG